MYLCLTVFALEYLKVCDLELKDSLLVGALELVVVFDVFVLRVGVETCLSALVSGTGLRLGGL